MKHKRLSLATALATLWLFALALAPAAWATQSTISAGTTSWTVPTGVTSIQVEMWGAGGGGGGVSYSAAGGAAGGGGGAYTRTYLTVTPGQNITGITVPSGGAAGSSSGGSGGTPSSGTIFPNATTANSGAGGGGRTSSTTSTTGTGGLAAASPADSFAGGNGGAGAIGASPGGGGGGGSGSSYSSGGFGATVGTLGVAGGGGGTGGTGGKTTTGTGTVGSTPGGGGGGGFVTPSGSTAGWAGGDGRIVITYTVNTYYYQSGNPATAANWNTVQAGGGTAATDFTDGNFIIPSGKTATATTDWTVASASSGTISLSTITINSGGKLDMAGHALNVAGSFNNNGTFISGSGSPTITFTSGGGFFTPGVGTLSSVAVQGAGGQASGTPATANTTCGGGGGGGCASTTSLSVGSSTAYTVIVGLGGNGGANGNNGNGYSQYAAATANTGQSGGSSIFSGGSITTLMANGGGGGTRGGAGGAGGTATGGTTYTGATGGSVSGSASGAGGGGAGTTQNGGVTTSPTSGGTGSPAGGNGGAAGSTSSGSSGNAPGGGGGGGNSTSAATAYAGGNGGNGQVIVVYPVPFPTETTPTQTAIGTTNATLGATVSGNGSYSVADFGIVWAVAPTTTPTTANNKIQVGTTPTLGSAYYTNAGVVGTSLPVNTQIYYGGYAINTAGTAYSTYDSFWTLANTPTAPTVGTPTANSLKVAIGGGDGNPGTTVYAIQCTNDSQYVQANGTRSGSAVYQTSNTWAAVTVTSLSSGTTYGFQVIATNGAGTATSFGPVANGMTSASATVPVVGSPTATGIADTTATLGATVTANGGASVDGYGVVLAPASQTTTPQVGGTGVTKIQYGTTESLNVAYTLSATSLTPGIQYYYGGYAHNSVGYGYSSYSSFYTLSTVPSTSAGAFTATAASTTSINLSWTTATGASGYLILRKSGASAPTGTPGNATSYSVGNTIGDGTVAAILTPGSATSATISSLTLGTQYSFTIIPFAWDGANVATYNYKTTSIPSATATTQYTPKYRSLTSGNWGDYTTWQVSTDNGSTWGAATSGQFPTGTETTVEIINGTTVTVAATAAGNVLTVDSTGILVASATLTLTGTTTINGTYKHNIDGGTIPTATWATGSTCEIDGVVNTAPGGYSQPFANLTWNCPSQAITVLQPTSIAGNYWIKSTGANTNTLTAATTVGGNLQVDSGAIFNTLNTTLTVTGTTTVGGTFFVTGQTKLKTFTGNVTINNGGVFQCTQAVTNIFSGNLTINSGGTFTAFSTNANFIAGNLTNNGTFTSANGPYTLSGTSKTIAGTLTFGGSSSLTVTGTYENDGTLTVITNTVTSPGVLSNNGTITVTTLSGTGGLTQMASSALNISDTISIGTLTATAAGNTVNYSKGGTQTILGTTYANLTLSGSNAKTLSANTTVNGTLTMGGTASLVLGGFTLSYGGSSTLKYAGTAQQTTAAAELPASGGAPNLEIANTSGVILNANKTITGTLTVDANTTLDFNSKTLTVGGTLLNSTGTLTMEVTKTGANTFTGSKLTQTSGTLTYNGYLTNTLVSGTLASGDTIPLFVSSGGFGGGFGSITAPNAPAGLSTNLTQLQSVATGGNITYACDGTFTISTGSLPNSTYGSAYSQTIATATAATSFSATGLPPGLSINSSGVISGTPTVVGTSNVTINAGNAVGCTASAMISLTINQASISVGANSTKNPSGYHDAVAFLATLPTDATGSVVFSSTNGPISTNSVSSGSATSLSITNLPRGTNVITVAYLGDGNYLGSTTNLEQIVTNHPPMLAPLNLTRTAGLGLHFFWSQLTNQWSDADGDAVNLTALNLSTTNSVSLITNATLIGYPSSAPNVADQINYTASDSYGDTVAGVINITVNAYVTGTNSIVNLTTGNPTTLKAYGVIGFSYITERSTNLTDWASIATNTVSTNGVISVSDSFSDLGGTPPSSAYYRIKWQP